MSSNKDRLGVLRRKRLACLGGPRLQDHRGALRTGLTQMRSGDVEVLSFVVDFAHARGLGEDAALAVQDHGVVAPRGLPQLVGDLDVLLCDGVAVIVLGCQ